MALSMPMTAPAVAAYLGILLAGCTAALIADSFAAPEIAARLRIAGARAIITQVRWGWGAEQRLGCAWRQVCRPPRCTLCLPSKQDVVLRDGLALPLYARVAEAAAPLAIVLPASGSRLQVELRPGDLSWQQFLAAAPQPAAVQAHVAASDDTASILFSSGTSGEPKAIPWSHVTPLRCAANAHFHQDVRPGDVVCWPTNMGWMLGTWLVFGGRQGLVEGAPCRRACWPRPGPLQGRPLSGQAPASATRSAPERRHDRAAARQPPGAAVWRVCGGGRRHHAGRGAEPRQGKWGGAGGGATTARWFQHQAAAG